MAKEMLITAECICKGERNVLSQGMKTAWVPWVVRVTYASSQSANPADLRTLPLFATGQDPEHRFFVESEMSPSLMAVQAHVQWAEQMVEHLCGTRCGLDETPGTDPKHTKIYFKDLTPSDVNELVDRFGSLPQLALMTSAMYEGRVIDKFPHVFNMYTSAARRSEVGPQMFAFLLSALWNDGKVLTDNNLAIHASSYTKIRVGCNVEERQQFMAFINSLTEFELSVKNEITNEPLMQEDLDSDASSVQSERGSVETCMIMGVPPFWKEEHLRALLESMGDKDFLTNKLPWNVEEVGTTMRRVQAPKAASWVGKMFRSKEGCVLLVISSAECRERKQKRLASRPAAKRSPIERAHAAVQVTANLVIIPWWCT